MIKPERRCRGLSVNRKTGPSKGCCAQRAFIEASAAIRKASPVAPEHLDIGYQVMAERHRLCGLQVSEAGHDGGCSQLGLVQKCSLQALQLRIKPINGISHPQPEISRHLIIAGPRRVEASGGCANEILEARFDIHMNIFKRGRKGEGSGFDLGRDLPETLTDGVSIGGADDALLCQHGGVGRGSGDVFRRETLIKTNRGIDLLQQCGRGRRESASPHHICIWLLF